MQHAWIISVGTELALGQITDTNAGWLATELAARGIRATRHLTVPDELDAVRGAFTEAAGRSDVILVTGGLGPTDDDLTRRAAADATGSALELHAPSLAQLRAFHERRGRDMPERNKLQAMLPRSATAIENTCGTAPGMRIELGGTPCFILPGVPFEMKAMFVRDVAPHLVASARGTILLTRRLHTFGLPESTLGERIADLMARGRNPEVGTSADLGIIDIRINATAATTAAAQALLDETEQALRARLGPVVYGRDDDTLASVVGQHLLQRNATLATAESCTGGLIGKLLTDVSGSSVYYVGGAITYANDAKIRQLGVAERDLATVGAVSEPVARSMAHQVAHRFKADYALSVTGVAGPGGGTVDKPVGLVFIGLHTPKDTAAGEHRFGSDLPRHAVRMRAAHTALNLLRLDLLDAEPPPDANPAGCDH